MRLFKRLDLWLGCRSLRPWVGDGEWWYPRLPHDYMELEEEYRRLTGRYCFPERAAVAKAYVDKYPR